MNKQPIFFTKQMAKQARALETETMEWQKRWEENNSKLVTITRDIEAIQIEVGRVHESLLKMTNLYHALDKERSSMMKKLGKDMETDPLKDIKLKVSTEKAK
jgi:predicted  nucleic acid-binding Zn-ribbon protein